MARKAPTITPTVRQADADPEALAMGGHLAQLDRLETRRRDEDAEDIEELRQAWAPALSQAKAILAELTALEAAYTPALEALAGRDFATLPPVARTLNVVAAIERTCIEIQHVFGHTVEDLRRIVAAVDKLNERSAPLLHANASTYRELIAFYKHAPQSVRELFQRLQRLVASLTSEVESAPSEETTTPVRRFPAPPPMVPEVEMA
jgi:hypothetical protein